MTNQLTKSSSGQAKLCGFCAFRYAPLLHKTHTVLPAAELRR